MEFLSFNNLINQGQPSIDKNSTINVSYLNNFSGFVTDFKKRNEKKLNQICKIEEEEEEQSVDAFVKIEQHQKKWTPDILQQFKILYEKFGPKWSLISSKIKYRTTRELRNWFNNSLRKIARKLELRAHALGINVPGFTKGYILSMLRIIHQIDRLIQEISLTINQSCSIFQYRSLILQLCFSQKQIGYSQIDQLAKLSRFLGFKLKCLGVFKEKNRLAWKLTLKSFINAVSFEPLVMESRQQIFERVIKAQNNTEQVKIEEQSQY